MIRVLDDRVLVALPPKAHAQEAVTGYTYQEGETTGSGIILAKPADVYNVDLATRGIVVQVGEKRGTVDLQDVRSEVHTWFLGYYFGKVPGSALLIDELRDDVDRVLMKMQPAPFDVQPGDCVLFPASAGDQIADDGVQYVILRESEIIGIVQPIQNEAA